MLATSPSFARHHVLSLTPCRDQLLRPVAVRPGGPSPHPHGCCQMTPCYDSSAMCDPTTTSSAHAESGQGARV